MEESVYDSYIKENRDLTQKISRLEHENEMLKRLKNAQTTTLQTVVICFMIACILMVVLLACLAKVLIL